MKNAMIGMGLAMALWMVPDTAAACGSYNYADMCGTILETNAVDLGDEIVAIEVHGGFATQPMFSFDGEEPAISAALGKVVLACHVDDSWCIDELVAIDSEGASGGFLLMTGWDGFPGGSDGFPAGVWDVDMEFDVSMLEHTEHSAPQISTYSMSFTRFDAEDAANAVLCRKADSLGEFEAPEPLLDLSAESMRIDLGVATHDPGPGMGMAVLPPAPEADLLGVVEIEAWDLEDLDVDSLRMLSGALTADQENGQPQTGCSATGQAGQYGAMLGSVLVLLAMATLRRRESSIQ